MELDNDLAFELIKRQENLRSLRSTWEQQWQEIDYFVAPSPNYFNGNVPTPGMKVNSKLFDATATEALNRFVAAMSSTLTPRSQRWHTLSINRQSTLSDDSKNYLEQVTDILFKVRYAAHSNFASQIDECYHSLGKYGTAVLFIDDMLGKGITYKAIHISQVYIAEDENGKADTVFRLFKLSSEQAYKIWGMKCPDKIISSLKEQPDAKFDFLHVVMPNKNYTGLHFNDYPYVSYYICKDTKDMMQVGGYRTCPYAVSRYRTEPGEIYGRCPAIDILPEIKTLNRMKKADLNATEKAVNPPVLASAEAAEVGVNLQANAINYGMVDENGRPMVIPFATGSNFQVTQEKIQEQRQLINEAFLVTLFQILVQQPEMTATEVQYRQQEKGEMLAPTMGRQQSELLSQIIERELDILSAANQLPPMPDELQKLGGIVDIDFDAPLNKIMRSSEANSILQALQTAAGLAQFDPSVIKMFNMPEAMRIICDIWGVPNNVLFDQNTINQMQDQQAQQQQLQQILQAAPVVSQSIKNVAQAQQAGTAAGPAAFLGQGNNGQS